MTDKKAVVYKGYPPDHCCVGSNVQILPNGEFAAFFVTGGPREPDVKNYIALCRSTEPGLAWSTPPETVLKLHDRACLCPGIYVDGGSIVIHALTHDGSWGKWRNYTVESHDNAHSWSDPEFFTPSPRRTFIRNRYVATWGEWFLPLQSAHDVQDWTDIPNADGSLRPPVNGVLVSSDNGQTWTASEVISGANRFAENNVVELSDGKMVMLIRSDGAGCLLRSDSNDRGRTWSEPRRTDIPNPGSKFRLFRLKGGQILLVHNPNPATSHPNSEPQKQCQRNPLSIWISGDDMESWGYRRDLTDFPGMLAYPDGVVDESNNILHIAFDYNRHDVIYWGAELPSE